MSILKENCPVGFCSDHAGYEMKMVLEGYFDSMGIEYKDFGTNSTESCDYADFAHPCAAAVENGECYPGIAGMWSLPNWHAVITMPMCLCFPHVLLITLPQ